MAEWRIGRGWTEAELEERVAALDDLPRNFSEPVDKLTRDHGWHRYSSEAVLEREEPGPPAEDGPFTRARIAIANYEFSDPRIVVGHFDPARPLLGRRMLLEMRAVRELRYLGGVVVGAIRSEKKDGMSVYGFRYETLEGHIERGIEWFLLTKDHATGDIRFRIEASWREGQFPNWWSRLGFTILGRYYQRKWHHRAHERLAKFMRNPDIPPPRPRRGRLVHTGPKVIFKRD